MRQVLTTLYEGFWSEWFWLPEGSTWAEVRLREGVVYHNSGEIWLVPLLLALLLCWLRATVVNATLVPAAARLLGLERAGRPRSREDKELEKLMSKYGSRLPGHVIEKFAQERGVSERAVNEWSVEILKSRSPTDYEKFQECSFQLIHHVISTILCVYAVYGKPWLLNISLCFEDHPHQSVEEDVRLLYLVNLSFYWCHTFWLLLGRDKGDFKINAIHHTTTIFLMAFSWMGGFSRMGTLVMITHEPTDIPLLLGKISHYAKKQPFNDVMFVTFVTMWIFSRVTFYPFFILWECYFRMPVHILSPSVYFQWFWGFMLLLLDAAWTVMISRVVWKSVRKSMSKSEDSSAAVGGSSGGSQRAKPVASCNGTKKLR